MRYSLPNGASFMIVQIYYRNNNNNNTNNNLVILKINQAYITIAIQSLLTYIINLNNQQNLSKLFKCPLLLQAKYK